MPSLSPILQLHDPCRSVLEVTGRLTRYPTCTKRRSGLTAATVRTRTGDGMLEATTKYCGLEYATRLQLACVYGSIPFPSRHSRKRLRTR